MSGLVAACQKEGTLNVITLPANWANYGTIMKDFTAKYGIKINDANPEEAVAQLVIQAVGGFLDSESASAGPGGPRVTAPEPLWCSSVPGRNYTRGAPMHLTGDWPGNVTPDPGS